MMKIRQIFRKRRIGRTWPLFILLIAGFVLSLSVSGRLSLAEEQAAAPSAELSTELMNTDCIKCHAKVVGTVEDKGAKHKSAVTCMDCHKGHPPMVPKENIIPVCSMCHAGKPHYEIGGCETCHSDPHAPLEMQLAPNLTDPCLSCHPQQGKEMVDQPSKHGKLFCTTCHKAHKDIPECLKCHQAHSPEMANKDCTTCHPAHQPLAITFTEETPSKSCAACHKSVFDTLTSVGTKHSSLSCVACHKEKHKYIPACESCHGSPHPAGMIQQFPKCNMCHISAHSLGKEAK